MQTASATAPKRAYGIGFGFTPSVTRPLPPVTDRGSSSSSSDDASYSFNEEPVVAATTTPAVSVIADMLSAARTDVPINSSVFEPRIVEQICAAALSRVPLALRQVATVRTMTALAHALFVQVLGKLAGSVIPKLAAAVVSPTVAPTRGALDWETWRTANDQQRLANAAHVLKTLSTPSVSAAAAATARCAPLAVDHVRVLQLYKRAIWIEPMLPVEPVLAQSQTTAPLAHRVFGLPDKEVFIQDDPNQLLTQRMLCNVGSPGAPKYAYIVRFMPPVLVRLALPLREFHGCLCRPAAATPAAGHGEEEEEAMDLDEPVPATSPRRVFTLKRTLPEADAVPAEASPAKRMRPADEQQPPPPPQSPPHEEEGAGMPAPLWISKVLRLPRTHGLDACRSVGEGALGGNFITFIASRMDQNVPLLEKGTLLALLRRVNSFESFYREATPDPLHATTMIMVLLFYGMFIVEVDPDTGDAMRFGGGGERDLVAEALNGRDDEAELRRLVQLLKKSAALAAPVVAPDTAPATGVSVDPLASFLNTLARRGGGSGAPTPSPAASAVALRNARDEEDAIRTRAVALMTPPVRVPVVWLSAVNRMRWGSFYLTPEFLPPGYADFCHAFRRGHANFFFGMRRPVAAHDAQTMGLTFLAAFKKEFAEVEHVPDVTPLLFWGFFAHVTCAFFRADDEDAALLSIPVDFTAFGI